MKCCVPFCKSYSNKKFIGAEPGKKVKFYQIPSNAEVREQWLHIIARKDWVPNDRSTVCSLHFQPNDFRTGLKISKLKPTAVPSIFPYPRNLYDGSKTQRKNLKKKRMEQISNPVDENNVNDRQILFKNTDQDAVEVDSTTDVSVSIVTPDANNENVANTANTSDESDAKNPIDTMQQTVLSDHCLLYKQTKPPDEIIQQDESPSAENLSKTVVKHSKVETTVDTSTHDLNSPPLIADNVPKRGRPTLTYSALKQQLYLHKKKVWSLNKKVERLMQQNKKLKEQLKEKNRFETRPIVNSNKFCTVYCIAADVENEK